MMNLIERRRWYFRTVASGSGGINYLLRVEFATDDAAPVTSPYAGEVGEVTITDTGNNSSVSGGKWAFTNRVGTTDPMLQSDTFTRAQGLLFKSSFSIASTNRPFVELTYFTGIAFAIDTNSNQIYDNNVIVGSALESSLSTVSANDIAFVLQSTGGYIFRVVSGNWRLIWYSIGNTDNVAWRFRELSTNNYVHEVDYIRVWQLATAPFTTLDGLAQLDQSTPSSGTDYTGTADMLADLVCTQDGSPTAGEKIQLIYRKSDANNYWVAYLERNGGNTDWDFKLDSVASGTPTNRVTATSVGTVTRIRVLTVGTSHKVFTYSGTTWSIRGTVTVSHNDAQTTINATYDAGNTVSRLISFARESANYSELDNG